jgi:TetR/AcrR family transcriptional regulator
MTRSSASRVSAALLPGRRAPRSGPRAARTRAAILAAAERLFAERGFEATRLEDVAEAVGIRRASIVYHFRDKPALYDAVLAEVFGGFHARIEPALLGSEAFAVRIERAVSLWIDYVAERPALARILLREVADGAAGRRARLLPHLRPFFDLVRRTLETPGATPPKDADPIAVASQVAGTTVFFVAAMPTLLPGVRFEPLDPLRLDALRREVIGTVRRLLGSS